MIISISTTLRVDKNEVNPMGNPIIQGWMRKKPMCFDSIHLSYQVLHFGHTVKLTFLCQGSQIRQIWRILRQNCSDDST